MTAEGGSAIVALRSGLFSLDLISNALSKLADPPFNPRTHRFNEVDCDPAGRLWLGAMFEPEPGVLRYLNREQSIPIVSPAWLVAHCEYALTPNGFAWSLDGRTLYLARSKEGRIESVEFDPQVGAWQKANLRVHPRIHWCS